MAQDLLNRPISEAKLVVVIMRNLTTQQDESYADLMHDSMVDKCLQYLLSHREPTADWPYQILSIVIQGPTDATPSAEHTPFMTAGFQWTTTFDWYRPVEAVDNDILN